MKPTTVLPDDRALPGLTVVRDRGLNAAIPSLGLDGRPIELVLRGYTPGFRATLEARAGDRRFAVKAYADDPSAEAALYRALAGCGLASDAGARVPPLLAYQRDLKVLVIGWLDGPTAHELIRDGRGERAGELAACWLQRAASLPVRLGPRVTQPREHHEGINLLRAADSALSAMAVALAERLERTRPPERAGRLVHGTFYDRHVLDLDGDPGVIDWERFGQGPVELDAGMFLATLSRVVLLRKRSKAHEAARARDAFLAGVTGLVDEQALAWHAAAALMRLAVLSLRRHPPARASTLLSEAKRLAESRRVTGPMRTSGSTRVRGR